MDYLTTQMSEKEKTEVCKALSSRTRWSIMQMLQNREMSLTDMAKALEMTSASISQNIKQLEKVGLITSRYEAEEHGVSKLCTTNIDYIGIYI